MPERENKPLTIDELQQLSAAISPRVPKTKQVKIVVEKDVVKLTDMDDVLITRINRSANFILNDQS
jgi:hypothetical protein